MTRKLVRWSWVLALPVSAVLAAPSERAVEVPLDSTGKIASRSVTTTKSGSTATHKATVARHNGKTATHRTTTVKERKLSMRDTAPGGPDDNGVYHSVSDWVPRTPTKASQAQPESKEANHAQRAHWWSRPQSGASTQKAEEVKP